MPEVTVNGWTPEEWAEIEKQARQRGMSAERYIAWAVREKLAEMPDPMEPVFHRPAPRIEPPAGRSPPEPTASGPLAKPGAE